MKVTLKNGRSVTLCSFGCRWSYDGLIEGRPGNAINAKILEHAKGKDKTVHVITPELDQTDPAHPKLPRYEIRCELKCFDGPLGADPDIASRLSVVFYCNDIMAKSMPAIIEDAIADLDWERLSIPYDICDF